MQSLRWLSFLLYCLLISFLFLTFAAIMKEILFSIVLTSIAIGLVYRNKGKWYDYVVAVILGSIVAIGLMISE